MKFVILKLIRFYQSALSFDHGPLKILAPQGKCKFYPSCSEYSYIAIQKYGILRGAFLTGKRLLRCNPWSKGGIDQL